jgi:tetratricopeptide (TPR) repeat protein
MNSKENISHLEKAIEPLAKELTNKAVLTYLLDKYKSMAKEKKRFGYDKKFQNVYFSSKKYKEIKREETELIAVVKPIIMLAISLGTTSENLERNLIEKNVPEGLAKLLVIEMTKANDKIKEIKKVGHGLPIYLNQTASGDLENNIKATLQEQNIQDPEGKIETEIMSQLAFEQPPAHNPYGIADHLINSFTHNWLEQGLSFDKINDLLRAHTAGTQIIRDLAGNKSQVEDFSPDFAENCQARLDEYIRVANLDASLVDGLSTDEVESSFSGVNQYWIFQLTIKLCIMVDSHLSIHFALEKKQSASLEHAKYYYFKVLQHFHNEFYTIHNAIFNLNSKYPLSRLQEAGFFNLIISDIETATLNYLKELGNFYNTLLAKMTRDERETVIGYLKRVMDKFMHLIGSFDPKAISILTILADRINFLDDHLMLYHGTNFDEMRLLSTTHLNGDNNQELLTRFYMATHENVAKMTKIARRIYQPIVDEQPRAIAVRPRTTQKKKPAGKKTQSAKTSVTSATQVTTTKISKTPIYQPNTDYRARHHRTVQLSESHENTNNWTQASYKKVPSQNRMLLDSAFKKISEAAYDDAILIFNQISQNNSNDYDHALYGLARCYEEKGEYQQAYNILNSMAKDWKENFDYQLTFGRICGALGHTNQAQDIFRRMSIKWKDRPAIMRLRAKYHLMAGDVGIAAAIYEWLVNKASDVSSIANLAYCYARIGKHQEALACLDRLSPKQQEQKAALFTRVDIYRRIGKFKQALALFKQYQLTDDIDFVMSHIKSLIRMEQFDQALKQLQASQLKFSHDKNFMILFAKLYIKRKEYNNALALLEEMNTQWPNDKNIIFMIAITYRDSKQYSDAIKYFQYLVERYPLFLQAHLQLLINKWYLDKQETAGYEEILNEYQRLTTIDEFKNCVDLYYSKCRFLIEIDEDAEAEKEIRSSLLRFPYEQKLYVLLIQALVQANDISLAYSELNNALEQFPDSYELRLEQFVLYYRFGSQKDAAFLEKDLKLQYAGNPVMERAINGIKRNNLGKNKTVQFKLPPLGTKSDFTKPVMDVTLPDFILKVFHLLEPLGDDIILAGGTVIKLVKSELAGVVMDISAVRDLDFSVNCNPDELLKIPGVKQNRHNSALFTLTLVEGERHLPIDLVIYKNTRNWLSSNMKKRDLTICSLAIKKPKPGTNRAPLYDTTGRGLNDLKNNILSTNCRNPSWLIETDPVCVLRVIKYWLLKFEPEETLMDAILHWSGRNADLHYGHLINLVFKYLQENPYNQSHYLYLLHERGIFRKIFSEHLPHLVLTELTPDVIDHNYINIFIQALNEQYTQLYGIGFYNVPDIRPINTSDAVFAVGRMIDTANKVEGVCEEQYQDKGKEKIKESEPVECMTLGDPSSWPKLPEKGTFFQPATVAKKPVLGEEDPAPSYRKGGQF